MMDHTDGEGVADIRVDVIVGFLAEFSELFGREETFVGTCLDSGHC